MPDLDLVYVIDARFEGGVSTAVAAELHGIFAGARPPRVGIVLVKAHLLRLPWPSHPEIRRHIDEGRLRVVLPHARLTAQIALVHHPVVFANLPRSRFPVQADRAILVLHHPVVDARGNRQYDLPKTVGHIAASLSPDVFVAPVSPVVRRSLRAAGKIDGTVADEDWTNLIVPQDWPFVPERKPPDPRQIVVGRHARPDRSKWPDTFEEVALIYGAERDDMVVRVLGAGPFLHDLYGEQLPGNWALEPFDSDGVADFLQGLDFYVYYHASAWSEAFGRTILEALACGVVTILPPHFEELFGPAALYALPEEVQPLIDSLVADPEAWRAQRHVARLWVLQNHAAAFRASGRPKLYGLRDISDADAGGRLAAPPQVDVAPMPVLFVSTNGIGVGHLTQQLAIADRLPRDRFQATFATMSFSAKVAQDAGYPVFYLPHHRHLGAHHEAWNTVLAEELYDLIRHLQPGLLAYDGTAVFGGLVSVLQVFPDLLSLWVRRAMWREVHRPFLEHAGRFSGVLEPGELAGDLDHGPTRDRRGGVHVTGPVLHIDPAARVAREQARAHYGLAETDVAVALQMGSGANFDIEDLRLQTMVAVLRHPNTRILEIVSPLAPMPDRPEGLGDRLIQVREFPSFLNSRAVDAAIGVAGYNAFHEQVLGGIPTLFVPNEAAEMDSQLTRAHWAEVTGVGLCLRARDAAARLDAAVADLLDPQRRSQMRAAMAALPPPNGAAEMASIAADYASMVRTDRSPYEAYPR